MPKFLDDLFDTIRFGVKWLSNLMHDHARVEDPQTRDQDTDPAPSGSDPSP